MFLYSSYPHSAHFSESPSSTWTNQQQGVDNTRVTFSSDVFTGGNGRLATGCKNGFPEDMSLGTTTSGQQMSMSPVTFLQAGEFQHLDLDQKPIIAGYTSTAMTDFIVNEKCRTCGEEMAPSDLIQHMRNHMGPRRCEVCSYEAPTKHHLREHLNTHTGLKPYKCQFCDKSFAAKNSLRVHTMYLHTKVRAHQCHFCDQRFVTTSERKSHELVHADKCPVCQMSFRLRGHLRQHMKSHANAAFHHKKR